MFKFAEEIAPNPNLATPLEERGTSLTS